jgi:hypothetical protein
MAQQPLLILLAREAGYFSTAAACRRLEVKPKELLALRRRALEEALGIKPLPMLAKPEDVPAPSLPVTEWEDL